MANREKGGFLVALGEDRSVEASVVGGKGASLGKLVKAGFPVPAGFVVATEAYAEFVRANGLSAEIEKILGGIDYANLDQLETETARIRQAIVAGSLPEDIAEAIVRAYAKLGDALYVAVRSSGTAEDLEGASFAGLYDTYLDIRGADDLLDAVRRCWGSMWTARVVAYRHSKGFDRGDLGMAVVVQTMVAPDVSGVMFVGNPMNARADETVINASWGLGEAVVSGIVTPDEYVVAGRTLAVKRRSLGTKETQIVRNRQTGHGTVHEPVPAERQARHTLSDEQAGELAEMGRRVAAYYEGLPQDIEWALSGGSFYLLQSRPVTGVDFTWEEDLDLWPDLPEDDDAIWSRAWADMVWHGAITPLFWTTRGKWMKGIGAGMGMGPMLGDRGNMRWLRYHRGTVYWDTGVDERFAEMALPPNLRKYAATRVHPSRMEKVMQAPFDLDRLMQMHARASERWGGGLPDLSTAYKRFRPFVKGGELYDARRAGEKTPYPIDRDFFQARVDQDKLKSLEDAELFDRVISIVNGMGATESNLAEEAVAMAAPPYGTYVDVFLNYIIDNWYSGDNENAYTEIISGVPERTQQGHDDYDFWELADTIRRSEKLLGLLGEYEGAAFFAELANHEEGRAFLVKYEDFLEMNGCRGHADRDIYYPRRIEDPMIDYQGLKLLAMAEGIISPDERDEKLQQRREAATAEVIENLAKQPMGEMKVAALKYLLDVTLKSWTWRDDERAMADTMTWSKKLLLCEAGRRAVERGLLEEERDFYFLSFEELRRLLAGTEPVALARAKVKGRAKNFDLFLAHEADTPLYMRGSLPWEEEEEAGDGLSWKGTGTSPGLVTARARVVRSLDGIGRLEKGDVLICNSTDPGWTPVFSIVSGIVAETGGIAAHFSCLSREYGMPAVSLPRAMRLIEDGATITVNGSTGEVRLASEKAA